MPQDETLRQQQQDQSQQQGRGQAKDAVPAGQPSPGLKDKEAPTSDSYGNTRESGETPK